MKRITVIGTGYVGLVSGACMSDFGNDVSCVDIDKQKIDLLIKGKISIYEQGLEKLVYRNTKSKRLHFSHDISDAIKSAEVIFIAVGTPENETGNADISAILSDFLYFNKPIILFKPNIIDNMKKECPISLEFPVKGSKTPIFKIFSSSDISCFKVSEDTLLFIVNSK